MQNNELTTQLAQISTVSGIEKLNTTLGSVSGQIDNSQSLQAANLIGHGVIPGPRFWRAPAPPMARPPPPRRRLALSCSSRPTKSPPPSKTPAATWCARLRLASLKRAFIPLQDGSLTDGTKAPNGSYQVAISASNGTTQLVAQPLQFAPVQGVIKGSDGNKLDLGTSGTTTLDEVRQII